MIKSPRHIGRENAALILGGILLAIVLPSIMTLRTVNRPINYVPPHENPTPFGYTVSLLLYLVPIALLTAWFFRNHPPGHFKRKAFFLTVGLLVPIGFALDVVFGNVFFRFPNSAATLELFMPGFSYNPTFRVIWDIPIEEFIFYLSGFVAILLVYIWCNEFWVPAYGVDDYGDTNSHPPYIIQPHWHSLGYAVVAVAAAYVHKKYGACTDIVWPSGEIEHCYRDGFPLYFTFLVLAALVPALLLYRCAQPFINWRAFSITLLWVLLTSLLWEATLASPFMWWHYEPKWMMNLPVRAWANLPVEAVFLWLAVTFTTTIVYETIKVALHLDGPPFEIVLGPRAGRAVTRVFPWLRG